MEFTSQLAGINREGSFGAASQWASLVFLPYFCSYLFPFGCGGSSLPYLLPLDQLLFSGFCLQVMASFNIVSIKRFYLVHKASHKFLLSLSSDMGNPRSCLMFLDPSPGKGIFYFFARRHFLGLFIVHNTSNNLSFLCVWIWVPLNLLGAVSR